MSAHGTTNPLSRGNEVPICSTITKMVGREIRLFPGENRAAYREGLAQAITEFGATTSLQVYLVEKIYEGLRWLDRLQSQRTGILMNRVVMILDEYLVEGTLRGVIESEQWGDRVLEKTLRAAGLSLDSVMAEAARLEQETMHSLDRQIADWMKVIKGFQLSYETLVKRKLVIERFRLQNMSLQRDIDALPMISSSEQSASAGES